MYKRRFRNGTEKYRLYRKYDSIVLPGPTILDRLIQWERIMVRYFFDDDGYPLWASNEKLIYDRKKKDIFLELYCFENSYFYRLYAKQVDKLLKGNRVYLRKNRVAKKKEYAPFEGGE